MTEYPQNTSPEKVQILEDDARKFLVAKLENDFVSQFDAISFVMTTDWLKADEDSETKLAHKAFDDGRLQILLISKHTKDGKRTSRKEQITQEQYNKFLKSSILKLKKKRHEFKYTQAGVVYDVKLDEFANSLVSILEVDADNESDRLAFDPTTFPGELNEVTGKIDYYGYRIASVV